MFVLGNTYVCPGIWDIWKCIKSEIVKSVLGNTYVCSGKEYVGMKILRVSAIALFFALFCYINSGP